MSSHFTYPKAWFKKLDGTWGCFRANNPSRLKDIQEMSKDGALFARKRMNSDRLEVVDGRNNNQGIYFREYVDDRSSIRGSFTRIRETQLHDEVIDDLHELFTSQIGEPLRRIETADFSTGKLQFTKLTELENCIIVDCKTEHTIGRNRHDVVLFLNNMSSLKTVIIEVIDHHAPSPLTLQRWKDRTEDSSIMFAFLPVSKRQTAEPKKGYVLYNKEYKSLRLTQVLVDGDYRFKGKSYKSSYQKRLWGKFAVDCKNAGISVATRKHPYRDAFNIAVSGQPDATRKRRYSRPIQVRFNELNVSLKYPYQYRKSARRSYRSY